LSHESDRHGRQADRAGDVPMAVIANRRLPIHLETGYLPSQRTAHALPQGSLIQELRQDLDKTLDKSRFSRQRIDKQRFVTQRSLHSLHTPVSSARKRQASPPPARRQTAYTLSAATCSATRTTKLRRPPPP